MSRTRDHLAEIHKKKTVLRPVRGGPSGNPQKCLEGWGRNLTSPLQNLLGRRQELPVCLPLSCVLAPSLPLPLRSSEQPWPTCMQQSLWITHILWQLLKALGLEPGIPRALFFFIASSKWKEIYVKFRKQQVYYLCSPTHQVRTELSWVSKERLELPGVASRPFQELSWSWCRSPSWVSG